MKPRRRDDTPPAVAGPKKNPLPGGEQGVYPRAGSGWNLRSAGMCLETGGLRPRMLLRGYPQIDNNRGTRIIRVGVNFLPRATDFRQFVRLWPDAPAGGTKNPLSGGTGGFSTRRFRGKLEALRVTGYRRSSGCGCCGGHHPHYDNNAGAIKIPRVDQILVKSRRRGRLWPRRRDRA
jgi:hypothetical protein